MGEILFLAHRIPWPADRGDKIRSYHILRHLAGIAPVHVAAFADDVRDMSFTGEMKPHFASVYAEVRDMPQWRSGLWALQNGSPISIESFRSAAMKAHIDTVLATGRISHIFCFSGQMAQYVPMDFSGKFVMDFVDVDSAKFQSYASSGNPFMRWINAREARVLGRFERDTANRACMNLFVSRAEADIFLLQSHVCPNKIQPLDNGIDAYTYDPAGDIPKLLAPPAGKLIVFTGQMDYRPNIEAVCDFAANAMPVIRSAHPGAVFVIVGRNPSPAVLALARRDGIVVTGAVDDVRSWIAAAHVVVAPLRIARGIQNKVLEAMAMAKAVVVSVAAAEGIDARDGVHFRIACDVRAEADHVCELLADPVAAQRIGVSARAHVMSRYAWPQQLAVLDELMGDVSPAISVAAQ
jgi:polysaccharide biosynthesis protein PslH